MNFPPPKACQITTYPSYAGGCNSPHPTLYLLHLCEILSQSIVFLIYLQRHKFLYPLDHQIITIYFYRTAEGTENLKSPSLHEPVNDRSITSLPSMFSFIFMNVARLLTQTKRKNEVLSDLCQLCFYVYVKPFYMKEYYTVRSKSLVSPLFDVTACLELVVESVCMYQIHLPMTYVWHTQILSVSYSYSGSTNQLLLLLFSCTAPPPHVQLKPLVIYK